jgi:hypothetical protein
MPKLDTGEYPLALSQVTPLHGSAFVVAAVVVVVVGFASSSTISAISFRKTPAVAAPAIATGASPDRAPTKP